MPLLLLLLLTLACVWKSWPQPLGWLYLPGDPILFAVLTWLTVLSMVGLAAGLAGWVRWQLPLGPGHGGEILRRYRTWRSYHILAQLAVFPLELFLLGWGWTVQGLGSAGPDGVRELFPGGELLLLSPFFVTLMLSWACFYDADRALHFRSPSAAAEPYWGRWAYVSFHLRQNLALISIPLVLLIAEKGLYRFFLDSQHEEECGFALLALLAVAFMALPLALRLVLRLQPLPPGPLRQRLETAARRLHFRFSNLLVWNTRGGIANAMVVGILPWLRYVVFTDRLLHDLTPAELEAVFGHEVGHIKHRHMLYYVGFLFVSLAAVAGLWDWASTASRLGTLFNDEDMALVPLLPVVGAYIFVVFGFLSRRCERQADVFGCRAVSCARPDCVGHEPEAVLLPGGQFLCPTGIRVFIEALEKVASSNGISRSRPGWMQSWQHSTIARRVDFLEQVLADPALEVRFQRRVALVKWALLLGLSLVLAVLWHFGHLRFM